MTKNKSPRRHHTLPEFYLKGFCRENLRKPDIRKYKKYHLNVYDIERDQYLIKQHISNVSPRKDYYGWKKEEGGIDTQIEEHFSKIEAEMSKMFSFIDDSIRDYQAKNVKTDIWRVKEVVRHNLVEFMRIMMVKSPYAIEPLINSITKGMQDIFPHQSIDRKDMKMDGIIASLDVGKSKYDFTKIWLNREIWIVYPASPKTSFITTDQPVARFNKHGADGIGYKDTEVYFPLTQNALLAVMGEETDLKAIHLMQLSGKGKTAELNTQISQFAYNLVISRDEAQLKNIVGRSTFTKPPEFVEDMSDKDDSTIVAEVKRT